MPKPPHKDSPTGFDPAHLAGHIGPQRGQHLEGGLDEGGVLLQGAITQDAKAADPLSLCSRGREGLKARCQMESAAREDAGIS